MDPTLAAVLTASLPVIGGILVAVLVAKITADRTKALERDKWKRDLYATFLHAAGQVRSGIRKAVDQLPGGARPPPDTPWVDYIQVAQKALAEIRIIAPEMGTVAGELWDATGALMKGVVQFDSARVLPDGVEVQLDRTNYQELDERCRLATEAFIKAAAKNLA
jgi:hypothetical protein